MEFEFSPGCTCSMKDEGLADLWALPSEYSAKDRVDMAMACGQRGLGERAQGCGCPRELGSPEKSGQKVPKVWSSYLILGLQRVGHTDGLSTHTHTHHHDTLLPKMLRAP